MILKINYILELFSINPFIKKINILVISYFYFFENIYIIECDGRVEIIFPPMLFSIFTLTFYVNGYNINEIASQLKCEYNEFL